MTKDINVWNLLYLLLILLPAIYIMYTFKIFEIMKKTGISVGRMVIQLFLVGIYLEYLFKLDNPVVNILYVLLMMVISTHSSVSSSKIGGRRILLLTFLSTLIPLVFTMFVFEKLILNLENPFEAMYIIPLIGMILGNCLHSQILVLNDFINSFKKNYDEYLFSLSMGANRFEGMRPFMIQALELSIKPKIANMATVGLVSLPGMMTGQILGGNLPLMAIKYQIVIMISIFSTSVFSSFMLLKFIEKFYFDKFDLAKEEFLK